MTAALLEDESDESDVSDGEDSLSDRIRIPLKLSDRCDGPGIRQGELRWCGAQAFVRVHLKHGELYFCAHHFSAYEPIFASAGYPIHDERELINKNPFSEGDA